MQNTVQVIQSRKVDLMDALMDIRLINISEINIVKEAVNFIDTKYQEHKSILKPESVAALILNREDVPSLYATSARGYNNQKMRFQDIFGIRGVKVRETLIPWAVDKILREKLTATLQKDSTNDRDRADRESAGETGSQDIFEILTNISLANIAEFQVIEGAFSHIQANYSETAGRINLSDVCALILNHETVPSLYASSPEEYKELIEIYTAEHQAQVNKIIHQMVEKIHLEGLEHSASLDSLIAVNHQRRKRLSKSWNS